jgi:hypothetical protein
MQFLTCAAALFIRGPHGAEGVAEWATLTVGQAATGRHIVVGRTFFERKKYERIQ